MKIVSNLVLAFSLIFLIIAGIRCPAQKNEHTAVVCNFTFQDTVCVNSPVTITNLSQGASTYYWKFCAGTPLSFPSSVYSGVLPGLLHLPLGITLVQEGTTFYAFITNSGDSTILRVTYQNSMLNTPIYDILNIPGVLTKHIFGIQVKNDNGNWFGFITNGTSLVRLNFGPSLANLSPFVNTVATSPFMNLAQGLVIGYDGTNWVGFCTNFPAKTITRFSWGNDLGTIPAVADLGNVGGLTLPMQPALISDSSGWYMFVANTTTLAQLHFGNSLMNPPIGVNLGNLTWISDNRGVSMFTECNVPYALLANHDVVINQLMQVHFKGGLGQSISVTPLGNTANLFETTALSETLDIGDTLFCIATNSTPSLSILYFTPCINSVLPVSTQFDPSPLVFPDPGTYTIKLTVDAGLNTEQQVCKEIEVFGANVDLGPDTTLCEGKNLLLDAGSGFQSYLWNNGVNTQTMIVNSSGTYSVRVTSPAGCQAEDSIHVIFKPNSFTTVDTTICFGEGYFAEGQQQTVSGTYIDTLSAPNGCEHYITTHLTVEPFIPVTIGKDTCMNEGTTIGLIADVPGATAYTWQDGSHDTTMTVTSPGLYWVRVSVNKCVNSDSIHIIACPVVTYFYLPDAFTPNGDGLNDVFRPIGTEIVDYHLIVFNRWGQLVFESSATEKGWDGTFNGSKCEPGVYTYTLTYRDNSASDHTVKTTGVVTLVR